MRALNVEPGVRVRCRGAIYVISHVLDPYFVLARGEDGGPAHRLPIADLQPCEDGVGEEERPAVDLVGVSDADWEEAQRRFRLIRPLLTRSIRTRAAVEACAREGGVHFTTIYRWIALYNGSGKVSSLIPSQPSGGRGSGRLGDEVEEVIREVIDRVYLRTDQPSVKHTVKEVRAQCRSRGLPEPSERSVGRRIRRLGESEAIARRHGRRAAEERFKPHTGNTQVADHPLALGQIDHTLLDVILVDEVERRPVGRPWLTVLVDVYSRMVLGFYVSLDPPGAVGTGLCFVHAALPKERWLIERGVDAPWPCWGFVDMVQADNAKEFRGKMLQRACDEYGTHLEFRPVKRPEYGSHIERLMGSITTEIHVLPGRTFAPGDENDYDSEGKAAFTLRELEVYMARWVTTIYHKRLHRGIGRTPLALWEEGLRGTRHRPGRGLPPRILDETRLRIDFMPFKERTVQQNGVVIDHVHYNDDVLRPYVAQRDPENPSRTRSFRFHRDPRDISGIYFLDPVTGQYVRIPYRDTSHPPISVWELRAAQRRLVELGRKDVDEQALFEAHQQLSEQREQAVKQTARTRRLAARRRAWAATEKPLGQDQGSPAAGRDRGSHPDDVPEHDEPDAEFDWDTLEPFPEYDPLEGGR